MPSSLLGSLVPDVDASASHTATSDDVPNGIREKVESSIARF